MGLPLTFEDLAFAVSNIETDFPSFLSRLEPKLKESSFVETELRTAFQVFDSDACGSVSVRQMVAAIDRFVRPVIAEEIGREKREENSHKKPDTEIRRKKFEPRCAKTINKLFIVIAIFRSKSKIFFS